MTGGYDMAKQGLTDKSISELRTAAKKAGIKAKTNWTKEDFIKAISKDKTSKAKPSKPKKTTAGTATKKTAVKKKISTKKVSKKKTKPELTKQAKKKTTATKLSKTTAKKPRKKATVKKSPAPKTTVKKPAAKLIRQTKKKTRIKTASIVAAAPKKIEISQRKSKQITPAAKPAKKPDIPGTPSAPAPPPERLEIPLPPLEAEIKLLEYDRDKVVSMPVTPKRLYIYWEISEDAAATYKGSLNIKVMDLKTESFFYVPISEKIGEQFISVKPEGEYTIEIGVIDYKGNFINILQFHTIETPASGIAPETPEPSGEDELPEDFFKVPETASSY